MLCRHCILLEHTCLLLLGVFIEIGADSNTEFLIDVSLAVLAVTGFTEDDLPCDGDMRCLSTSDLIL